MRKDKKLAAGEQRRGKAGDRGGRAEETGSRGAKGLVKVEGKLAAGGEEGRKLAAGGEARRKLAAGIKNWQQGGEETYHRAKKTGSRGVRAKSEDNGTGMGAKAWRRRSAFGFERDG